MKRRGSITIHAPRAGSSGYLDLHQNGKIQAEYIWIGGSGMDLRSKTKTLEAEKIKDLSDFPEWNFDGSSTAQAPGDDSEVWLKPVKYVPDPFRKGKNVLVLCECLNPSTMQAIDSNKRFPAFSDVFSKQEVIDEEPWYGIEQEYTLFEEDGVTPLGWPRNGYPAPQGPYYCSVGTRRAFGREVVEAHYRCCLYAGLDISGVNAEVMPGQWEFQIGPAEGIDAGDQLWLARYILHRVAEEFNICVSFDAKPIKGDWNGAGAHTNFSTKTMRTNGEEKNENASRKQTKYGMDRILEAIEALEKKHEIHMDLYGKGNQARLTGQHETAHFSKFSYGVANRGASIRIPRTTHLNGYGYLEDRRPSAACDPYEVTAILAKTTIISE